MVLKNCKPEFSYILAELFNMCLKECYYQDCDKTSLVVLVFKNVGENSTGKNYSLVGLLSMASKVFEKLVNKLITNRNVTFFLVFRMVLDLFNQLQIL